MSCAQYVFGTPSSGDLAIPKYGTGNTYPCKSLYKGWSKVCSKWGGAKASVPFDKSWHAHNLQTYAEALKQYPIFMNQFEVVHGVSAAAGRYGANSTPFPDMYDVAITPYVLQPISAICSP
jgi:hypothetical protein